MRSAKLLGTIGVVTLVTLSGAGCSGNGNAGKDGGTAGSAGAAVGAAGGQVGSAGAGGRDGGAGGSAGQFGAGGGAAGQGASTACDSPGARGLCGMAGAGGSAGGLTDGGVDAAGGGNCGPVPPAGPTWSELPAPPNQVSGLTVTDAWPAGQDDFFFAGAFPFTVADGGSAGWAVLRWTHGCWTVELQQTTPQQQTPRIAGTSPSDVWLTAGDALYHRDQQAWTQQDNAWRAAIPANPFTTEAPVLTDVQPLTSSEVWFTAQYAVLRLLNGQWQAWELTSGSPNQGGSGYSEFRSLWVSVSNDVWAVGGAEVIGSTVPPASAYHFDGTSWTTYRVGNFDAYAIWPAAAPEQFWVAVATGVQPNPLTLLDGNASPISAATSISIAGWPAAREIVSLWGRSSSDVWAAGEDVAHYDGTAWAEVPGTPDTVTDLNQTGHTYSIVTGDATSTWLVGRGPTFYRQAAPSTP